jgi:hypothetical protein
MHIYKGEAAVVDPFFPFPFFLVNHNAGDAARRRVRGKRNGRGGTWLASLPDFQLLEGG